MLHLLRVVWHNLDNLFFSFIIISVLVLGLSADSFGGVTNQSIVSYDISELQAMDQKINNYMIKTVPGYNAERWGEITEHPTEKGLYILVINFDDRRPLDPLSYNDHKKTILLDHSEWKNDKYPYGTNKINPHSTTTLLNGTVVLD